MLDLVTTSDKIEVITSAATAVTHVHASFVEATVAAGIIAADSFKPDNQNTNITGAATSTVVTAPASNRVRTIKELTIRNTHASILQDVTVQHVNGSATSQLIKVTLNAGDALIRNELGLWSVHEAVSGGIKTAGLAAATDTALGLVMLALVTDMEAGSDVAKAVTAGRQHRHPSACKAWLKAGVTANILASYNITSLTDTGTGDVAVTIATDFSSAEYCCSIAVQRINSTAAEANARVGTIKTASLAAGTFSMDCWDVVATTNVIKDPTSWHATLFGDHT